MWIFIKKIEELISEDVNLQIIFAILFEDMLLMEINSIILF